LIPGEWGLAGKSEYRRSRIGIRLINEADAKYNGKNPEILADGLPGSIDHGDGRWLGINGKNLDVIIDPGKKVRLEKISISILESTTSWIFRPEQILFLISVDGSNFSEIRAYSNSCSTGENKMKYVYDADIPEEVRLLRIMASPVLSIPSWHPAAGLPAWIFADEITITY
jgi:hexosaminidase